MKLDSKGIAEKIKVYLDELEEAENELNFLLESNTLSGTVLEEKIKFIRNKINAIKDNSVLYFSFLYTSSIEDNYFYFDCPSELYKSSYTEIKRAYFQFNKGTEIDFLKSEYSSYFLNESISKRLITHSTSFNYSKVFTENSKYQINREKKVEFLKGKLLQNGIVANVSFDDGTKIYFTTLNINNKSNQSSIIYNSNIFIGYEEQIWFHDTLKELGVIDDNSKAKTKFQAVCSSIFSNDLCKEHVFKYNLLLKDFIGFLNDEYSAKIKSNNKLSTGIKHEIKVDQLIKSYLN